MPSLDYVFKYDISIVDARVLTSIYDPKLQIEDIKKYKITDVLNDIAKIEFEVENTEKYYNNLVLERTIKMPILGKNGIITKIVNKDTTLVITAQETAWHLTRRRFTYRGKKETTISTTVSSWITLVGTSANLDDDVGWERGLDIVSSSNVNIPVKYHTHLDVLKMAAKKSGNDLWFEGREINIGKKGKLIDVSRDVYFFDKLDSVIDLDKYANIVDVVGKDSSGRNSESVARNNVHDFNYNYEKVVVNNNLIGNDISAAASRLLDELNVSHPNVETKILITKFKEYDIQTGDVLKLVRKLGGVKIKGYYRVIKINANDKQAKLSLEFSENGKFVPKLLGASDVIKTILDKVKELELQ